MREDLAHVLNSFDPIRLAEMESVTLLDRTDTKFIFNYNKLPGLLGSLGEHYKILDINGVKQNRYETLYFDTPGFKLYLDHHNGRTNRYKVRYRKYVDSGLVYFEVKYKNNKGRTIKSRIKRDAVKDVIEGKSTELLHRKSSLQAEGLQSKIWVNYSRITFVSKHAAERMTMDVGLHFKNGNQVLGFENIVIAEVKQKKTGASPFISLMKLNHVRKNRISKYCFGVISIIDDVKKNYFKPHILRLNKMSNETTV